jgi:5-methylcytosine-specific restriction endonuclease McrA
MCFASITPFDVHGNRGRKQSPEQIRKRTESMLKTRSEWAPEYREEVRQKLSDNMRGQEPWNKGRTCPQLSGENHGMFGKHHTDEAKLKNSLAHSGLKQSAEHIQKKVDARAGYRHSEETKRQIRETNLVTWAIPEVRNQSVGENNPTWKDGISFVPYPVQFNIILKERIRNRDGRICQSCGKTEEENGQSLDIHHVDYDKKNLSDENLISLCFSCHRKSFNRNKINREGLTALPLVN